MIAMIPPESRQLSNFRGALKGASDRDISEHLLISVHTVKEYGKSIRRKYRVKSRLQLISMLLGQRFASGAALALR